MLFTCLHVYMFTGFHNSWFGAQSVLVCGWGCDGREQVKAHLDLVHVSESGGSSSSQISPPPVSGTQAAAAAARSPPQPGSAATNPSVSLRGLSARTPLQKTPISRSALPPGRCSRSVPVPDRLCPTCPTPKHPNAAGSGSHLAPLRWRAGWKQTERSRAVPSCSDGKLPAKHTGLLPVRVSQ